MSGLAIALLAAFLCFAMGFAIRRGTVCVVAATQDLVVRRRPDKFIAFATAACWSGLVLIPLAWGSASLFHLSPGYAQLGQALLFGALFAVGAWINQACGLGTLAHLTGGRLGFVLTLVGWVAGALLVSEIYMPEPVPSPSILERSAVAAVLAWVFFAAICWWSRSRLRLLGYRSRWRNMLLGRARMRPFEAMLVIGIGGGVLYASAGNWTYMGLLSSYASQLVTRDVSSNSPLPALVGTMMMILGGVTAAVRSGGFRLRGTTPVHALRHAVGGTMMGAAVQLIPGGNGVIIVYGIPSIAPHAISAYLGMTATLAVIFAVMKYSRRE
ncbi:YeeE/YedE thiosulfate transporter family protein [Sphingopyxis sp. EG6]|uniref:YeeE/YedE thiosulfate transporter family protein n=1 Tax=Sphingopyxis sp. EG6 TaxID=1874061 RepID=UPI000DC620EB|nr:YeeE/YedE thiosulfate transporter family protein [Sphingopyxis sp. EG6]BBB08687.1 hypothetical protein SPYCW_1703 [Sphingopyxis sp. EG6]